MRSSKLKTFCVDWKPSIRLIVTAHNADEAKAMVTGQGAFTIDFHYGDHPAYRKGCSIQCGRLLGELMYVTELTEDQVEEIQEVDKDE